MKAGVVLINFGEPERPDPAEVAAYLERIFLANARLEPDEGARRRARQLAELRTPSLVAENRAMGGSPLHAQTAAQAGRLRAELAGRGLEAAVVTGMQFTEPDVAEAVAAARDSGAASLVGLPLYPLTGPSTTTLAVRSLQAAVEAVEWAVPVAALAGWHTHPEYTAMRADAVRAYCADHGIGLDDPGTRLVLSAHGTPIRYLREGSRYDRYVQDHARRLAAALGVERYELGYQNHDNRPGVEWTGPSVEAVVRDLGARRIVVVPISFMQEQSETLFELDHELRELAVESGMEFHRVPVPHDDARFTGLLADLLEPFLDGGQPGDSGLARCECISAVRTYCLAGRGAA